MSVTQVEVLGPGLQRLVLSWIANPLGRSIDAAMYADAIVELLQKGYVVLEGTLAEASVRITDAGAQALGEKAKES